MVNNRYEFHNKTALKQHELWRDERAMLPFMRALLAAVQLTKPFITMAIKFTLLLCEENRVIYEAANRIGESFFNSFDDVEFINLHFFLSRTCVSHICERGSGRHKDITLHNVMSLRIISQLQDVHALE